MRTSIVLHGEGGDCPNYDDWLEAHRSIMQGYTPRNILNFDETALSWRAQSHMTFIGATEEKAGMRGRKSNKARIILLVGCAADGTKQELIYIGAAANPCWHVLHGNRGRAKAP